MNPVKLLLFNATLQIFVSSVLGVLLLIPMQPWGKAFLRNVKNLSDVRSTHIDWLLLAFLQFGIALALSVWPVTRSGIIAILLVFSGWMNAVPYLVRGFWGINAFAFSGSGRQRFFAALGFISVLSLLTAVGMLLFGWIGRAGPTSWTF
jgi:hypothetical protein